MIFKKKILELYLSLRTEKGYEGIHIKLLELILLRM